MEKTKPSNEPNLYYFITTIILASLGILSHLEITGRLPF